MEMFCCATLPAPVEGQGDQLIWGFDHEVLEEERFGAPGCIINAGGDPKIQHPRLAVHGSGLSRLAAEDDFPTCV